jgi:hypothetical protein
MTTTTTTNDKIRITMSERRPLSVSKTEWPVIARADWYNGEHEFQANTIRKIRVRQHADGRRLVYGLQEAGNGGQHIGTRNPEAGFLLPRVTGPGCSPDEEGTVRAIRRVAGILGDPALGDECIADLPAEDLDSGEEG